MHATMNQATSVALLTLLSIFDLTSAAPGPVVLPYHIRVQIPQTPVVEAPYLTCSGLTTSNVSLAANYYLFTLPPSAGELRCGEPDGLLIGAPNGVATAVFQPDDSAGSIHKSFSVQNQLLKWENAGFADHDAIFHQRSDEDDNRVFAEFKIPQTADVGLVNLVVELAK